MSKILELSTDPNVVSQEFYPDAKVVLHNPMVFETELPFDDEEFDGVFANYIMNKVSWRASKLFLDECARVLKPRPAVLHVIVPSIKWIAKQFWQEELPPHVKPFLFGEQTSNFDIGRNAFTMLELRIMFDHAGLAVIKAKVGAVEMLVEDESYQAEQLYVAGVKNEIDFRNLGAVVPGEES